MVEKYKIVGMPTCVDLEGARPFQLVQIYRFDHWRQALVLPGHYVLPLWRLPTEPYSSTSGQLMPIPAETFRHWLLALRPRLPRPGPEDITFGLEVGGVLTATVGFTLTATVHIGFVGLGVGGVFMVLYSKYRRECRHY